MILNLEVPFHSQEISDSYAIERIKVDLSEQDKENILKACELVNNNEFIDNIRISVNSEVTFFDDEDNDITDFWKCEVFQFIVYNDCVFLYAQNKFDSGDQIESNSFFIVQK